MLVTSSLNAPNINITADSQIQAKTNPGSSGTGGNITVTAPTAVNLTRENNTSPVISVETSGAGKAGEITINTPNLTLSDAAQITAKATKDAPKESSGGNVTLNASTIDLNGGTVGVFADTDGQAPAGTLNLKPYKGQSALNIIFTPGSTNSTPSISASTSSSGRGGDINRTAPRSIFLSGAGKISVETSNSGDAGSITVSTQRLALSDNVQLLATTTPGSNGKGGNIQINADTVNLNQSTIAVNSQGTNNAGDITIIAPGRITLDNRSQVTASSTSGNDGNITIDPDILLLRRGSQISTSAGNNNTPGNGGNINITAGFVVSVLSENSDIVANAFTGNGGRITINANSIFGFLPAPQGILVTRFSDIAASSQFGISGFVILNTLNVDPSQGLGELNLIPIDSSNLVAQSCVTGKRETLNANRFTPTGSSGIPASPDDVFRNGSVLTELGTPTTTEPLATVPGTPAPSASTSPRAIVEAQELIIAPNGKARLVAQSSNATPASFQQPRITCPDGSSPQRP